MKEKNKFVEAVRKFEDVLCKIMTVICTTWYAGLLALIVLQVFTRFVLKQALPWTDEGARYLWATLCFLGCGTAISRGTHIEINIIGSILSNEDNEEKKFRIARIIDIIKYVLTTGMGILLTYLTWSFVSQLRTQAGVRSAALLIPMWVVYTVVLVGTIGIIIHSICRLILAIGDHQSIIDPLLLEAKIGEGEE